jgi:hypothetical protein
MRVRPRRASRSKHRNVALAHNLHNCGPCKKMRWSAIRYLYQPPETSDSQRLFGLRAHRYYSTDKPPNLQDCTTPSRPPLALGARTILVLNGKGQGVQKAQLADNTGALRVDPVQHHGVVVKVASSRRLSWCQSPKGREGRRASMKRQSGQSPDQRFRGKRPDMACWPESCVVTPLLCSRD